MQKAGDFPSPVGSALLDDNLAITKLCMRASCSHCNGAKVKGRASVSGCVLSTLLHPPPVKSEATVTRAS